MAAGVSYFSAQSRDLAALETAHRKRGLAPRTGTDFSSNDYLGLADAPELRAAAIAALAEGLSIGSGGSRLLRGNHPEHEALEAEAAAHFGSEAALFFASGFAANAALFATLPQRGDLVVHDALIHASAHEGLRLGRAEVRAAAHNQVASFDAEIADWRRAGGNGRVWIAIESLYSMDGDMAPITAFADLANHHDAILVVDEAHATGTFGDGGRGLAEALAHRPNVITLRTCGKALGVEGALICGPAVMRDFLINRARGFIFSTAPSPLIARIVREAIRLIRDDPDRQRRLHALIAYAGERLSPHGVVGHGAPILTLPIGDDAPTMQRASALQARGFDIRGIRPPTVPEGTARLRIAITCNIDEAAIDRLATALRETA